MAQDYKYTKADILKAAKSGTPIKFRTLNLYPLTVADYELLWGCESALTIRLSALPVTYAIKSYPEALFAIAVNGENVLSNGDVVARPDDWLRFMFLLGATARIPQSQIKKSIGFNVDKNDKSKLISVTVMQRTDTEENFEVLSVADLNNLREIITTLNGRKLPDESENVELAQADIDIKSTSGLKLDFNLDSLLASVARDQRVRIRDLYDWTIYEFELIRAAIERERRFTVFGIGENSGMVKFPKGNPFPSIFFDKPADSSAVISASEFTSRLSGAVETADKLPDNLPIITR
jgi:hypothetical protein